MKTTKKVISKKSIVKKATGGATKKKKPENWIQSMRSHEREIRDEEDFAPAKSLAHELIIRPVDTALARLTRKTLYAADDTRVAAKKTSNFIKDVAKKAEGKKPINKNKSGSLKTQATKKVNAVKKQVTKTYNAVNNFIPKTVKKVAAKK